MNTMQRPEQLPTVPMLNELAASTWQSLATAHDTCTERFQRSTLEGLPAPAQRLLAAALPENTPLHPMVSLEMIGEIKLGGRWLPFTALQVLRAAVGFVWAPIVGGRFIRFTGADVMGPNGAGIEFRLHGRIPVVRGSGPDIACSAAGRLAVETVAWLPQALAPQAGAKWEPIDDRCAAVMLKATGKPVRIEIAVGDDGAIEWLGLQRWNDSLKPPGYASFGGSVTASYIDRDGVRIAGAGEVGWDWRTPAETDGAFFRYRVTSAEFAA